MNTVQANEDARFKMKLGVIGSPEHRIGPDGTPWAYEPYVREMRVWAELFSLVEVCGSAGEGPMRGNMAPYRRQNIQWLPVNYCQENGVASKLKRLSQLPGLVSIIRRTILDCDLVLLRSPSHFSLVGAAQVRLMKRRSITKWAGENGPYKGERMPSRLDRYLEGVPNPLNPVLVYGPAKRPHHVSFIPALMLPEELAQAREKSKGRTWVAPWRILSVGRLVAAKGFDLALRGLAELQRRRPDLPWHYTLIGDGAVGEQLRRLCAECGLTARVTFAGALPFSEVQNYYGASHVVIMPGVFEGWPKIIAEAWAHDAIPVAASAGIVPSILQEEGSGVAFEPTPTALADVLARLLGAPARMKAISEKLHLRADAISLNRFKTRLEQVLVERCGLS